VGIAQGVHLMAIKAEERIPRILELAGLSPLRAAGALEQICSPGAVLRPTG
jgi:hypothetical protein